jgi:glucosamine--fructose-6-phosphate aminotransferase (isomerizing)
MLATHRVLRRVANTIPKQRMLSAAVCADEQFRYRAAQGTGRLLLGCVSALTAGYVFLKDGKAENCGIVGVVGGAEDASNFLLEGLLILRNRGYDSAGTLPVWRELFLSFPVQNLYAGTFFHGVCAGIATVAPENADAKELLITKYASRASTSDSIDLVMANASSHKGHFAGIAHTRWATHGGKTDANSHPHVDYKQRVAVIHNGTINNSYELKDELQAKGIKFSSETDTEVIAQLIGVALDKGLNTKDAVAHALARYVIVVEVCSALC